MQDRIALALKLSQFFTAQPSYEVPDKDVTAAEATALHQAVIDAQDALQTANVALRTAAETLRNAQTALVGNMRFLIKILSGTLGAGDPRWEAFGLNMPATNTTPGQPQNVTAFADGAAAIVVSWDPPPLASRYRVRARVAGSGLPYDLAASSVDPMARILPAAPGVTVEIIVQAVNGGSQGVASEPVLFTMPGANAPAAEVKSTALLPEMASLSAIAPNGNGNGNGSLATSRIG